MQAYHEATIVVGESGQEVAIVRVVLGFGLATLHSDNNDLALLMAFNS